MSVTVNIDALRVYETHELGGDGYPSAWHDAGAGHGIKHLVRELAGHRCVRCHHPYRNGEHGNGEWSPCDDRCDHDGPIRALSLGGWIEYASTASLGPLMVLDSVRSEARWRILTVHHLTGCKPDCRWWNLAALCQRCHLQIQGRVRMERTWPWEHTEWFQPYVAGFYAWTYLRQDVTRDEAVARLDELLGLERMGGGT